MNFRTHSMDELARRWTACGEPEVAAEIASRVATAPDPEILQAANKAIAKMNIEALQEKTTQATTRVAEALALLSNQQVMFDQALQELFDEE